MTRSSLIAVAAALCPSVALADTGELARPRHTERLDTGSVEMVVYYFERDHLLEVVATYAVEDGPDNPKRMRTALAADGESVVFNVPSAKSVTYIFSRMGGTVNVCAEPDLWRNAQRTVRNAAADAMRAIVRAMPFGPTWGEPAFEPSFGTQ